MRLWQGIVLALLWALAAGTPAGAIDSDMTEPPAQSHPARDDYAAGLAAFEAGDWQAVLDHMGNAIQARPWHADAYNRMGFAARKLGDYDRALRLYDKALELDPHHRGALEYLGEAYLELDRPHDAAALLERLATACQRVAHGGVDWQDSCGEWQDLKAAYDAYGDASARPAAIQ
jgi:tetratricopeptide (TPR) repeat protein